MLTFFTFADVTGPADTTKGVITIYDIFGYYPQTLQGADILATSGATKYKVFMPDWFKGEPCPIEWFPPNTEEKQKNLGAFFQKNPPPGVAAALPGYVKAVSEKYPEIKDWAVLGVSNFSCKISLTYLPIPFLAYSSAGAAKSSLL